MRSRFVLLASILSLAPRVPAQNVQQQASGHIVVPAYTTEQRWNRMQDHWVAFFVGGTAQAKASGKTPEDYGRFIGDLFAPTWGARNTGTALGVARSWLSNFMA